MKIYKLTQSQSYIGFLAALLFASITIFSSPNPDLEKRVSELEGRVTVLEETLEIDGNVSHNTNFQNLTNWRKLRVNMSYKQVEELLGEPQRINGGSVARWSYPNRGTVTFIDGELHSWNEPR